MAHLKDRTALITGTGRSVGRGIAERLAEDGAFVVVNDLHADRAEETVGAIQDAGGRAIALIFDVNDIEAASTAFDAFESGGTRRRPRENAASPKDRPRRCSPSRIRRTGEQPLRGHDHDPPGNAIALGS